MFGISLPEFLVIIILLVVLVNPKDIPQIAKQLTKYFFKAKNIILQLKHEVSRISYDIGLEEIKKVAEEEVRKEQENLRKTIIIDIYGNEHEVHNIKKIRGDLAKEDLESEIEKYNQINSTQIESDYDGSVPNTKSHL